MKSSSSSPSSQSSSHCAASSPSSADLSQFCDGGWRGEGVRVCVCVGGVGVSCQRRFGFGVRLVFGPVGWNLSMGGLVGFGECGWVGAWAGGSVGRWVGGSVGRWVDRLVKVGSAA